MRSWRNTFNGSELLFVCSMLAQLEFNRVHLLKKRNTPFSVSISLIFHKPFSVSLFACLFSKYRFPIFLYPATSLTIALKQFIPDHESLQ